MDINQILKILKNPGVMIFLGALVGSFTYWWQEKLKRNIQRYDKMSFLYEEIIKNLFKLFLTNIGADKSHILSVIEKSWLHASKDVLEACYDILNEYDRVFHQNDGHVAKAIVKDPEVKKRFEDKIGLLFYTMRKDLKKTGSKVKRSWITTNFVIYSWGALGIDFATLNVNSEPLVYERKAD